MSKKGITGGNSSVHHGVKWKNQHLAQSSHCTIQKCFFEAPVGSAYKVVCHFFFVCLLFVYQTALVTLHLCFCLLVFEIVLPSEEWIPQQKFVKYHSSSLRILLSCLPKSLPRSLYFSSVERLALFCNFVVFHIQYNTDNHVETFQELKCNFYHGTLSFGNHIQKNNTSLQKKPLYGIWCHIRAICISQLPKEYPALFCIMGLFLEVALLAQDVLPSLSNHIWVL